MISVRRKGAPFSRSNAPCPWSPSSRPALGGMIFFANRSASSATVEEIEASTRNAGRKPIASIENPASDGPMKVAIDWPSKKVHEELQPLCDRLAERKGAEVLRALCGAADRPDGV